MTLVGIIIYITVRLKRRRPDEASGPYKGTLVHHDHPAAQISPFGGGGPHSGRTIPQFEHTPGTDMRIAFRRPDGAWHFADSRTPFTPSGVKDIDVHPPASPSTSFFSFNSKIPSNKEREVKAARDLYKGYGSEFDFETNPFAPPPPAYHRESCNEYFDGNRSPV
ncbi:hypothetical protein BYT27DRAFT_7192928 [Phlegmacium glaucopus]|nr:hypothetical protein BYT27DRAFT_7192928 [Phlegmacium glaucopus]